MIATIRNTLIEMAEPEYQKFSSRLLPGVDNILGVRIPKLRKYARKVWKEYGIDYLKKTECKRYISRKFGYHEYRNVITGEYMEEILLQGMIIGNLHGNLRLRYGITDSMILELIRRYVPKIDNWSTCDSFCAGLKIAEERPDKIWQFLPEFLYARRDFDVRFGIVMIIDYYIKSEYLELLFPIFNQIGIFCQLGYIYSSKGEDLYYVEMALAWAISICYIKYPERTMEYLQETQNQTDVLSDFIYNKSLQKITESKCILPETKDIIKQMKRASKARSVKK